MEKFLGNVRGKDGNTATISFVEPIKLAPGSKPTVENLGSNTNAVIRFGIPSGDQGAPGASIKGEKGDSIKGDSGAPGRAATINVHGTTLVDDEADVKVMNVGSENNASLHFYLKRPPEEITIDEELIPDSTNPVQSKAIQEALDLKADSSSIPTKVSELTNDRNFVSETSVNVMIEDAVEEAVTAANPVDSELSTVSTRPVQNKVIASALGEKATMTVVDALDPDTQTKYGEMVTLSNADKEVSLVLTGQNIESVVLSQNFAERIPTIVSELPIEGSLDRLYLVPSSGNNYSMHIWMDVDGVEKWVNIQSGGDVDLSGYATKSELSNYATTGSLSSYATKSELSGYATTSALNSYASKSDAIKNITRNGTTFTATRADNTTFTFTQQDNNTTYDLSSYAAKSDAIKNITRNGTVFTATRADNTTFTFDQQYSADDNIIVEKISYKGNSSISAGMQTTWSRQINKYGYTPIGILGVKIVNATTNSVIEGVIVVQWFIYQDQSTSYWYCGVAIYNNGASVLIATDNKVECDILYKANN